MVAPKRSATQLRRNLMQAKGSPEQHKHMHPSQLCLIQRLVQTAWQVLTKQKLAVATFPETFGWCETQIFYAVLRKHNDPDDEYCLPLFSVFVIDIDIKQDNLFTLI